MFLYHPESTAHGGSKVRWIRKRPDLKPRMTAAFTVTKATGEPGAHKTVDQPRNVNSVRGGISKMPIFPKATPMTCAK